MHAVLHDIVVPSLRGESIHKAWSKDSMDPALVIFVKLDVYHSGSQFANAFTTHRSSYISAQSTPSAHGHDQEGIQNTPGSLLILR